MTAGEVRINRGSTFVCLLLPHAGQAMLRRHHGLRSALRMCARRAEGRLAAHAWLEHDGAVSNDGEAFDHRSLASDQRLGLGRVRWEARLR